MRFRAAYQFRDYTGAESETGYTLLNVSSVAALDTFVLAQESILQALSDAPLISATAYAKRAPGVVKPVTGPASVATRLLVLLTNGPRFGSFVIYAPRADLDYLTTGPYAGIKIAPGPNPTATLLDELAAALANTVLPDGSPFPTGEWQAVLMSNNDG